MDKAEPLGETGGGLDALSDSPLVKPAASRGLVRLEVDVMGMGKLSKVADTTG